MILNIKLFNFLPTKPFTVGILFDITYLFIFVIFDFYNTVTI